jgi:hypothetical protein
MASVGMPRASDDEIREAMAIIDLNGDVGVERAGERTTHAAAALLQGMISYPEFYAWWSSIYS